MQTLFLPGYACTSTIWQPVCDELGNEFDITLMDWPRAMAPAFEGVGDFADWLCATLGPSRFDCIIGHSMGGLVALEYAAHYRGTAPEVVLIESFLRTPEPFFRNMLLEANSPRSRAVHAMLAAETPHYAPALAAGLRDLDLAGSVAAFTGSLHALYGDRGSGDAALVADKLGWPEPFRDRMDLHVVPNACHFPMLENPQATARILRSILR